MEKVKKLLAWWKRTRVARALRRYGNANGALLAGGIAFSALFSIFAALAIGFTVFMAVLGQNTELRDAVLVQLDEVLPGIVDTGDGGMLNPDDLQLSTAGGIVGIVAVVVLLNTAITVITNLRRGVRAMFGIISPKENPAIGIIRDLGTFVVLGLAILLTAVLGIAAGAMATWLLDLIGLGEAPFAGVLLRVAGLLVALAIDTLVFVFIYRVLAGVRPPRRDLVIGAAIAGIGAAILRHLGTSLVGSVENPLLGSYAALVTLLLWVNLVVRLVLLVAAWTANPPVPPTISGDAVTHFDERPNYVTVTEPHTLTWDHDPVTGQLRPVEPVPDYPGQHQREPYWGGLIGWVRDTVRKATAPDPEPQHRAVGATDGTPQERAADHQAPKDPSDPNAWGGRNGTTGGNARPGSATNHDGEANQDGTANTGRGRERELT
ncbi:MAG TPA: YihY/virulence factor BrkB family protein [Beutenbergiaceae bacterium]|nr:YihY/virulence factor BrkB family protein [Beutenbergiaceae bacterium]